MTDTEFEERFDLLTLEEIWERTLRRFDVGVFIGYNDLDKDREEIRIFRKGGVLVLSLLKWGMLRSEVDEQRKLFSAFLPSVPDDSTDDEED